MRQPDLSIITYLDSLATALHSKKMPNKATYNRLKEQVSDIRHIYEAILTSCYHFSVLSTIFDEFKNDIESDRKKLDKSTLRPLQAVIQKLLNAQKTQEVGKSYLTITTYNAFHKEVDISPELLSAISIIVPLAGLIASIVASNSVMIPIMASFLALGSLIFLLVVANGKTYYPTWKLAFNMGKLLANESDSSNVPLLHISDDAFSENEASNSNRLFSVKDNSKNNLIPGCYRINGLGDTTWTTFEF